MKIFAIQFLDQPKKCPAFPIMPGAKIHFILLSFALSQSGHSFAILYSRGSRFLIYNFLQFAIDGKNCSKTKIEKVFFLFSCLHMRN
jgi:hypothetical protein